MLTFFSVSITPDTFLRQAHSVQTHQLIYLQNSNFIFGVLFPILESYIWRHVFDPKLENLKVFNPLEWQQLKCLKNTNYWQGRTAKGTFLLWQWNCELANHCENSWHYHAMLKIHTPYDSVIF